MPRFLLVVFFCLLLFECNAIQVMAELPGSTKQDNEKGPAYTSPPKDDVAYQLMGEFAGVIKSPNIRSGTPTAQLLGLQVRTIGNDTFDAIAYYGGLPGQRKHQPEPIHLVGKRSGDFVILSGGPWAFFVEQKSCRVLDRSGKQIGNLKRIKRRSPTMYAPAPAGAIVLFDGSTTNQFTRAEITMDGLLEEGADVKPMFQDFNLHVEFRLPYMPVADEQKRANSGLYLQSRYECQVLDSFAQTPKINGCGSLYRFKKPDLNMCFPPLVWQTYDVHFTAPRWAADGTKIHNARVTSWVNGVKVQDNVELPNKTGAGKEEQPTLLPIRIQDHGDPVRFRNIWVVDRGLTGGDFPVRPTREQVKTAIKAAQAKTKQRALEARKRAELKKKAAAAAKIIAEAEAANALPDADHTDDKPAEATPDGTSDDAKTKDNPPAEKKNRAQKPKSNAKTNNDPAQIDNNGAPKPR